MRMARGQDDSDVYLQLLDKLPLIFSVCIVVISGCFFYLHLVQYCFITGSSYGGNVSELQPCLSPRQSVTSLQNIRTKSKKVCKMNPQL
jgi:hypothetical protein